MSEFKRYVCPRCKAKKAWKKATICVGCRLHIAADKLRAERRSHWLN